MDVMEGMTPKAILRPLMRLSVQSFKTGGWAAAGSRPSFQARSRRLPSSLGTVAFSLVKYVSGMAERGQMRATTRRKVMDTVEKPVAMMGRHGLNHTITRSRNRQWSKFAPSAAVLDHHVMFLASAHKETSLRSSSTTERACYHAIYNPTKKKCLQHLLTRKRFLYFCSRNGFILVRL